MGLRTDLHINQLPVGSATKAIGYVSTSPVLFGPFTGATDIADGLFGLVPAPLAGEEDYVLKGNGLWGEISSTYTLASPSNVTVGGMPSGTVLTGRSLMSILEEILVDYIEPTFSAFSVTGQSTTVEVGTTLSGSKTFTWTIAVGSGTVPTIDIYDITAVSTLVAGTTNDGTQAQTVTTLQLNSNGATQQWRGIGNNTDPAGTFNSSTFTVTGRYYRFFGPTASSPTNSATVRALPSSAFQTGTPTFTLSTGTTETKFVVALPPSVTITSVIDLSALSADITSEYILTGTISVLDAGGTSRTYNIYEMNLGAPYATSHSHSITTS